MKVSAVQERGLQANRSWRTTRTRGQMGGTVSLSEDGSRATITARERGPLRQKMNPIWWFMNSAEQTVDEAPWYRPAWPYWRRWLYWNLRNPLQNLRAFVLGVSDRNYQRHRARPSDVRSAERFTSAGDRFSVVRAARRRPSGASVLRELQR